MEYILLIIGAVFVNNIVLSQTLGICPFLGVSNKLSSSVGMGAAVVFVITLATVVTYLINRYLLVPLELGFLQTIAYILVIAALVQMVEIVLKKSAPRSIRLWASSCRLSRQTVPYWAWPSSSSKRNSTCCRVRSSRSPRPWASCSRS